MSFTEYLNNLDIPTQLEQLHTITPSQVESTLSKQQWTLRDLPTLLSPAAEQYIEQLATLSHHLTIQRFGKTMQLFIPMYLSNVCYNTCTYCGFSIENKINRLTLSPKEILEEGLKLKEKGFDHILLLTGEAPGKVGVTYIADAIRQLRPHFSSIGIEIQPLDQEDYAVLIEAGADTLTIYQETYHKTLYPHYHTRGKKKNFDYRLECPERGAKAGFYRINIGALLGLAEWRYEAIALAHHLHYLHTHHWKTKYGISFPRINKMAGEFTPKFNVSDKELVHYLCIFRLLFPDLNITLSTREAPQLRNNLFKLGITSLSAESDTAPGGYTGKEAEPQFEIEDKRSIDEVKTLLESNGYDAVVKDWDRSFIKMANT